MADKTETELIQLLVNAQRAGSKPVIEPEQLEHIDLKAAYRISSAQQEALGEEVAMYKTAVRKTGGPGVASPISLTTMRLQISHNQDVHPKQGTTAAIIAMCALSG